MTPKNNSEKPNHTPIERPWCKCKYCNAIVNKWLDDVTTVTDKETVEWFYNMSQQKGNEMEKNFWFRKGK